MTPREKARQHIRAVIRKLAPALALKTTTPPKGLITDIDEAFIKGDRRALLSALHALDLYAHEICYVVTNEPLRVVEATAEDHKTETRARQTDLRF